MNRHISRRFAVGASVAFMALAGVITASADESPASVLTLAQANDLVKAARQITDTVLEHHVDPPARQQMLLDGIKALYKKAHVPVPAGLSRRVSALTTPEQLAATLLEVKSKPSEKPVILQDLEMAFRNGLLQSVSGEPELASGKDLRVAEQIEGNRYVGLHIALAMDDQEQRPKIHDVIEGGPADKAGVKKGDIIEQIDGTDTKEMSLREAVDRLRGDEGTEVTIRVRQPKEPQARTMKIARGVLPRTTVSGIRKRTSGDWDVRLNGPDAIGYVRISDLSASTPHELRKLARQIESEGLRSIVIDLRGVHATSIHPAVLVADALLDHGTIGRVWTAQREVTYEADSDALFRGWPMEVLVDQHTSGTAAWLAAALEDNQRATLVGRDTSAGVKTVNAVVRSTVPVADGPWAIALVTGYLERGNGQMLTRTARSVPEVLQSQLEHAREQLKTGGREPIPTTTNLPSGKVQVRRVEHPTVGPQQRGTAPDVLSDPAVGEAIRLLQEQQRKKT